MRAVTTAATWALGGVLLTPGVALAGAPADVCRPPGSTVAVASSLARSSVGSSTAVPFAVRDTAARALTARTRTAQDTVSDDLEFVLWVAQTDEREAVRSAAWRAVLDDTAEAIARFLESEWDVAAYLATYRSQRNKDFVAYVIATHLPAYSREVCAAAHRAARGTDSDREAFVRTGYAAAKARDRQAREAAGKQVAALVQADRDFVAVLRDGDPGAQVRAGAAWALRDGAVEADLVEFFSYGWGSAAALDMKAYRAALARNDVVWRRDVATLVKSARAAEKAAGETAGEAAAQWRAAAARDWASAGRQTSTARVAWADAEQVALAQAESWQRIAIAAAAAAGPNWEPIAGSAGTSLKDWQAEQENTRAQAAYWKKLYDDALAGEQRTQDHD